MNPAELGLRDIHLPDPVSWWPFAPGWWLLLIIGAVLGYLLARRLRLTRVRRAARRALRTIAGEFQRHRDSKKLVRELSTLLRRVCLTYHPRRDVAHLTGAAWLDVLRRTAPDEAAFSDAVGVALAEGPYNPSVDVDGDRLLDECTRWVDRLPPLEARA